jgi:hypothetical protein
MNMSRIRLLFLGLAVSASLGVSKDAEAQHCAWRFDQSFALLSNKNLRVLEKNKSTPDMATKIEEQVDFLFGPRQKQCEEGAYALFLNRYERYVTEALRGDRADRDLKLRAASAAIRKSPELIDYTSASKEVSLFRQVRSNLGAIAHDVGMTPLMQQLLDAMEATGAPKATQRPPAAKPDPHTSAVVVPTVPLPAWAVISLYEIDDHTRRNEVGAIQGKVEAILNWMKSVTPAPQPKKLLNFNTTTYALPAGASDCLRRSRLSYRLHSRLTHLLLLRAPAEPSDRRTTRQDRSRFRRLQTPRCHP